MQIIFAFTINSETKAAAFSGNVEPAAALPILQTIVIANAVSKAQAAKEKAKEKGK